MARSLRMMLTSGVAVTAALVPVAAADAATTVRSYTGTEQTFVVPPGVTTLRVVAVGAKGGDGEGTDEPGSGAFGSVVSATLAVTPGDILYVEVGGGGANGVSCCSSAFNGGGVGGVSDSGTLDGAGGGGASDVRTLPRTDPNSLASRVLVAAGGGGGSGGSGLPAGDGGAGGQPGEDPDSTPAQPGGANSGGAAGPGPGFGTAATDGGPGVGGTGGGESAGGGGGGGGRYGGGGGAAGTAGGVGGGGGGGSNLIPIGGTVATATTAAASVTLTDIPSGPGGTGGGTTGTNLAAASKAKISPGAFPAAPSGPSALSAAKRKRRRYGAVVSYTLNQAASVRFTVQRQARGRRGSRKRCLKPTKKNRKKRRCTRYVPVRGSFTRAGKAGSNKFRFMGRLRGKKLRPGRYRLVMTPTAAGRKGTPARVRFRVVR